MTLVVDAANVVGSRPDGWWRDRAGAAARLITALSAAMAAGTLTGPVLVVLEGAAKAGVAEGGTDGGPRVRHAASDGDSTILAEVTALRTAGQPVTVVTSDRALRAQVGATGAQVLGASWLHELLRPNP